MFTLYTDPLHRIAYATDASAYREVPEAVTFPENEQDIVYLIKTARERNTHLIPRAGDQKINGGSSLLPALFRLRPEIAVTAFATFLCAFGVRSIAVHTDGLVQKSALCLFEACHLISSETTQ